MKRAATGVHWGEIHLFPSLRNCRFNPISEGSGVSRTHNNMNDSSASSRMALSVLLRVSSGDVFCALFLNDSPFAPTHSRSHGLETGDGASSTVARNFREGEIRQEPNHASDCQKSDDRRSLFLSHAYGRRHQPIFSGFSGCMAFMLPAFG